MKSKHLRITPTLIERLRLAVGMRWRAIRPGLKELAPAMQGVGLAAGLIVLFGIVGRLDYEAERAAELEAKADSLAYRAALADDLAERLRLARTDIEYYEDWVTACIRGDREWVLDGKRWECQAKPVGPYIPKEN